ncbi:7-deoxyloganetic acid glucosyltransferase-like [Iris pallida]|uniref:Glycosyltransferase n=1 Tax=Iris pallida TaxID=29817 RepID=A0AAX6FXP5_IRIPA|nr:7-deoxyloganetic acid glucosyltransferase-like [Iris pallida]
MANTITPHVLLFPMPAQGHLLPMTKLADLLSHAGLYVTFLATEGVYQRCFLRDDDDRRDQPRFRFRTVPDGLPRESSRPFVDTLDGLLGVVGHARGPYRELLASSRGGGGEGEGELWPPVTCVVADGFLPFALDVPVEMGIPVMVLRTSSPCSVWAYCCIPELIKRGEVASPDEPNLDESIQGVAGMEGFLRRRDLPGFVRKAQSADDPGLQFFATCSANLTRARALILNTFEALDSPVISRLRDVCPDVYGLGPLHLLGRNVCSTPSGGDSGKLWREDRTCMAWLDRQPDRSVVYVSFGSITVISREELLEFWHGLIGSGKRFLWVVRSDLVAETSADEKTETPLELEEGTRERGCLVGWAPQEEVLAHRSVGCFLTHSGWNSTLEGVVAGVPMVCWPFLGDQYTNSRFVSEVWRNGLDMKDAGGRDVVERMVKAAMDGEGADELRRSASKLAEEARESAEEGGSSYLDYQRLVQQIKSLSSDKSYKEVQA